jgi:hypothetical protein
MFLTIKNNENIKLYYTDTDSLFTNLNEFELNKIIPSAIGPEIGKLKKEYGVNRAIFLAPKSYFLELDSESGGKNIIKIKGLSSEVANNSGITFEAFYEVLKKDKSIIFNQEKWNKSIANATITIIKQAYELKHNANKRELIYNDGLLVGTKPYIIDDSKRLVTLAKIDPATGSKSSSERAAYAVRK